MSQNATITLRSQATSWRDLASYIQDALFNAQHGSAGLRGAKPKLTVLLSRSLLNAEGSISAEAMEGFCTELRRQGVAHGFHCVAQGSLEPTTHLVQITLE